MHKKTKLYRKKASKRLIYLQRVIKVTQINKFNYLLARYALRDNILFHGQTLQALGFNVTLERWNHGISKWIFKMENITISNELYLGINAKLFKIQIHHNGKNIFEIFLPQNVLFNKTPNQLILKQLFTLVNLQNCSNYSTNELRDYLTKNNYMPYTDDCLSYEYPLIHLYRTTKLVIHSDFNNWLRIAAYDSNNSYSWEDYEININQYSLYCPKLDMIVDFLMMVKNLSITV